MYRGVKRKPPDDAPPAHTLLLSSALAAVLAILILFGVRWFHHEPHDPLVNEYIRGLSNDYGAQWAEQFGYLEPVGKSKTTRGYTFRVVSVLTDPLRTVVYWTISGPDLGQASVLLPTATFNLRRTDVLPWGHFEHMGDRIGGHINLPPLPNPKTVVRLSLTRIGIDGPGGQSPSWHPSPPCTSVPSRSM